MAFIQNVLLIYFGLFALASLSTLFICASQDHELCSPIVTAQVNSLIRISPKFEDLHQNVIYYRGNLHPALLSFFILSGYALVISITLSLIYLVMQWTISIFMKLIAYLIVIGILGTLAYFYIQSQLTEYQKMKYLHEFYDFIQKILNR